MPWLSHNSFLVFFPHLTAVWTFKLAPTTGFLHNSDGKESAYNAGDPDSIPGLGRSPGGLGRSPGEGNGNPLQYSCLENPMDRGAWRATVHGVARVGYDLATEPPNHHHRLLSIRVICVLCPDCLMGWVLERRHWFSGLKTMLGTLQGVINVCRLDWTAGLPQLHFVKRAPPLPPHASPLPGALKFV